MWGHDSRGGIAWLLFSSKTEFGREFIAVALSKTPDKEIEPELLRVAVKWARIRVIEAHPN
jgi:hypothetical protein